MSKFSNADRAKVLAQALPYIKKYAGETVVIKYGGNAMKDEALKEQVLQDMVLLRTIGVKVVLVHGGGPEINSLMDKMGMKPQFVEGLRITDKDTIDLVQMVLAGKVNKDLVNIVNMKGGKAIGLSGIDDKMLEAEAKDERLGYVGEIKNVNIKSVLDLTEKGYIPVIATLGCDEKGNAYNLNGDTAAASIASALKARRLILMTDVAGIMRDPGDPESLIPEISFDDAKGLYEEGVISGGMIPKVECAVEAIENGVNNVVIMDGTIPHSILMELLTSEGAGTLIKK